jgi:D-serine deaminase-like pyridoxal phosphate-dependent protein
MTDATPTPSLVIDLPTVKRNIARLADYGREHKLSIRPHTKTHKSIRMAKLQLEAGAAGLTVAKIGEAMTMAEAGPDIFIAYPALDPWRRERLANLAKTHAARVGFDSNDAADLIGGAARRTGATIGVLVDLDVGFHRTGVQTPQDAVALAQHVTKTNGLRLDGIMCFPGHLKWSADELRAKWFPGIQETLTTTVDLFRKAGLCIDVVSGGSSPTAFLSHHMPALTEIRPGTYIYNDMNSVAIGFAKLDDCAARLTCTVVSTAVPGKFVIDAGSKSLTSDRRAIDGDTAGHGHVVEYPGANIVRLSEEHGEVKLPPGARGPKIGERVHVVPNHICPCVNLQTMAWVRDESGKLEPMAIDARGMVW